MIPICFDRVGRGEVISQSRQVQDVFEQPPASSSKPDDFYLLFDSVVDMFGLRLN